ncbi:hypothetical protein DFH09DRAFT_90894 [Mycena vulgaris]|nr:hypothetical protein DFH09DRAFT_90894 [Mycena vulgaris]
MDLSVFRIPVPGAGLGGEIARRERHVCSPSAETPIGFPSSRPVSLGSSTTSAYLRHLGTHLEYLAVDKCYEPDEITSLDFSSNTALTHLEIGAVAHLAMTAQGETQVSPILESILSCVMPYTRIEELIIPVSAYHHADPDPDASWIPLSQFANLLDTQLFATVRTIEFIVSGNRYYFPAREVRERWEPILRAAISSRSNRKISCSVARDY